MSRARAQYVCAECGGATVKWQGQCPHCSAWNTLQAEVQAAAPRGLLGGLSAERGVVLMNEIPAEQVRRYHTGSDEFDRVLGGGLVAGSVVLIGGDPGIGKSTLLLQAMGALHGRHPVLYVSGEESAAQIAMRARRIGGDSLALPLLTETALERIVAVIERDTPEVVVIDSIQTLYVEELSAAPGSVSQVRECAARLTRLAKQRDITLVMIGHVTKEGTLAGPRVLEHIVDAVVYFEGDTHSSHRIVRAFKNRFGAVNEMGVFAMTDRGLRGVSNPSALFLSRHERSVAGSCVMATQEGTRPLLVEIQALVDTAHVPNPRRLTVGLDGARLAMLLAVLSRHAGLVCADLDVFVNAVGGVRIGEPAADLAVCCAVVSSLRDRPIADGVIVFGEVGLAGEIRPAPRGQERLREAAKLGFSRAIVPKANLPRQAIEGLTVVPVTDIRQALAEIG
ncbi:MAG: DNA repair protein RadA [Burkholderiaceae bacterium]